MSKDTIYREDAIGALNGWLKLNHFPEFGDGILYLVPSADRPQGEWVQISPAKIYECSICGQNVITSDIEAYKWCHGCGCRMKGTDDVK